MKHMQLFFIGGLFMLVGSHACSAVGKNAAKLAENQRENVKRIYNLVSPKFKNYSASKVPLFTGDSEKRTQRIIQKSNITKFLQPKYAEKNIEENFLDHYRPTNGGTLLIDVINNNGESKDLQTAIDLGEDVNAADRDGNTALHHLIKSKRTREKKKVNLTLVAKLLEAGANIHVLNKKRKTPLGLAEKRNMKSIVEKMKAYEKIDKN